MELAIDLWLAEHNRVRIHQGKMCCDRTPIEMFLDDLKTLREMILN